MTIRADYSIVLTKGFTTIVDKVDYKWASQHLWHAMTRKNGKRVYANRSCTKAEREDGRGTNMAMHREVMEHALGRRLKETEIVDHINRNPLDNRRKNLRIVTPAQSVSNRGGWGKSKYYGVHFLTRLNKWASRIKINGKDKHLGVFTNERDAYLAYKKARDKHLKGFFIPEAVLVSPTHAE